MCKKDINFELKESGNTVLCLDYKQSGVGSGSCVPNFQKNIDLMKENFVLNVVL